MELGADISLALGQIHVMNDILSNMYVYFKTPIHFAGGSVLSFPWIQEGCQEESEVNRTWESQHPL